MKTNNIFLSIFVFLMCCTDTLEAQWQTVKIDNNSTFEILRCVYFTDANTGYAMGGDYCKVFKTTTGGASWTETKLSNYYGDRIIAVDFVDKNIGYALDNSGIIFKTIDAGITWTKQTSGITASLNSVCFTNTETGYAIGDGGLILKTTDGGINWKSLNSKTNKNLYSATFVNDNIGYVVGEGKIILKTVDAGATWVIQLYEGSSWFNTVFFTDENTGFATTYSDIYKTTNGGRNWSKQKVIDSGWLNSIFFANKDVGYITAENSNIFRTTDGGKTWMKQNSGTTRGVGAVFFTDPHTGYILYGYSGILKTTTGGVCAEKPDNINGEISFCNPSSPARYSTAGATFATSYKWQLSPTTAGTISSNGTTADVTWNNSFTGKAVLSVSGVNNSGCVGESTSISLYVNNSGTSVGAFSLSAPTNGSFTNSTPQFQWNLAQGASTYNLYIDGKLIKKDIVGSTYQISQNEAIASGMHTWYVEASNGCSLISNETWSFRVDDALPIAFDLISPTNDIWTKDRQPTFTWNASGDTGSGLAKYQMWINGNLFADEIPATTNSFTPTSQLPNGINNWQIKAVDKSGNVRNSSRIFVLKIDNTPPGLIENFETGDFSTVFNWKKNFYSIWSVEKQYNADNEYSYAAKSGEINDYQSSDISFTVDLKSKATISFSFKVSSETDYDFLYFYLNGISSRWSGTTGGWKKVTFDLLPGVNSFKWSYVKDDMRSAGSDCAWIDNIQIDSKLITPKDGQYITYASQQFEWSSAPDSGIGLDKYQLFIDNILVADNLKDTVYTIPSVLSYGSHKCHIEAVDLLGNSRNIAVQIFSIDNASPSPFNLKAPLNMQIVNLPTPDFTWEATTDSVGGSGLSKYQLVLNDKVIHDSISIEKTTIAANKPLLQGKYTWYMKAYDKVGNYRNSNNVNTFYVDWEDPLPFALISPANGSELGANPEFKWHSSSDIGSGIYKYELNITGKEPITVLAPDTTYVFKNDLSTGNYTWSVKAYDLAGNFVNSEERTFSINSFTVSVSANPATGGIALGEGLYPRHTSHTVTAAANTGYTFTNWTENGTTVSTEVSYTFTVDKDRTLVANFIPNSYTITVSANPTAGGTISGGGTFTYGTSQTITATANTGYTFTNWTENGTIVSTEASYMFTVDKDRILVANFEKQKFKVSVTVNPAESGTVSGVGVYNFEDICTLTAHKNKDFVFVNWSEDNTVFSQDTVYSFPVIKDMVLIANFKLNTGLKDPSFYNINIYSSQQRIRIKNAEGWDMRVIDNVGKTIYLNRINSDIVETPVLLPGIYVVYISKNENICLKKLIIQ